MFAVSLSMPSALFNFSRGEVFRNIEISSLVIFRGGFFNGNMVKFKESKDKVDERSVCV